MLTLPPPGNSAGAPLGGAILSGTGNNWTAVSCYSGGLQILGATVLLYGEWRIRLSLSVRMVAEAELTGLRLEARLKREPKVFARY